MARPQPALAVHEKVGSERSRRRGSNPNRDVVAEICLPAPPITDETQFVSVTVINKRYARGNFVLVWDFLGQLPEARAAP